MKFHPLTDDEWATIAHLFPYDGHRRYGRTPRHPRDLLNAILWVLVLGERWHRLPPGMPPGQTCYIKFLQWRRDGTLNKVARELRISIDAGKLASREENEAC